MSWWAKWIIITSPIVHQHCAQKKRWKRWEIFTFIRGLYDVKINSKISVNSFWTKFDSSQEPTFITRCHFRDFSTNTYYQKSECNIDNHSLGFWNGCNRIENYFPVPTYPLFSKLNNCYRSVPSRRLQNPQSWLSPRRYNTSRLGIGLFIDVQ